MPTLLDGGSKLTPLFLVLLIIEATDVMFALDNVPALYSIVPSGNVLAGVVTPGLYTLSSEANP